MMYRSSCACTVFNDVSHVCVRVCVRAGWPANMFRVRTARDMVRAGRAMAGVAQAKIAKRGGGCLILLNGEPGAGKTVFAKGFIQACMQSRDIDVPSPTFCLSHEYWCKTSQVPVQHVDLYRLETPSLDCLNTIGIPAMFENSISLVEWPDRLVSANVNMPYGIHINISTKVVEKQLGRKGDNSTVESSTMITARMFEELENIPRTVCLEGTSADDDEMLRAFALAYTTTAANRSRRAALKSPCNKICTLAMQEPGGEEICLGCGRSRTEITKWSQFTDAEREQIMARVQDHEPVVETQS